MEKVWILGTTLQQLADAAKEFEKDYWVQTSLLNNNISFQYSTTFIPDYIMIYLENINRQKLFGVMDIRESECFAKAPVLIIGTKEECDIFEKNVHPGADFTLGEKSAYADVRRVIRKMAETKKEPGKKIQRVRHVLAIDDDPAMLHLIRSYLQDRYQISIVNSGKAAVRFLEKHKPDLIFLDYLMPGWDGTTTLQLIRSVENMKDVPVVFLTGVAEKERVMECISLRPQGYIVKPVSKEALDEKLLEIFNDQNEV